MKRCKLSFGASVVAGALSACEGVPDSMNVGRVEVALSIVSDQCGIERAEVLVDADAEQQIGPVALEVRDDRLVGEILEVPSGTQRRVTVRAYDVNSSVVYEGSKALDIQPGESARASVTLYRNFDHCPIPTSTSSAQGSGSVAVEGALNNEFLAFSYSAAAVATGSGQVFFLDDVGHTLRTLELGTGQFGRDLAIPEGATALAVAPDGSSVYVAYGQGRIDELRPAVGERVYFGAAAARISSMEVVGDYLFVIDASGAWATESLFSRATGVQTSRVDWRNESRTIAFSPTRSAVFTLRDGSSPGDINRSVLDLTTGTVGQEIESPYHGDYSVRHPLRLFPDESKIATGSGIIYNTDDLTYSANLGMDYVDLAFHGDRLYLLTETAVGSAVVILDGHYAVIDQVPFDGTPERIFAHGDGLIVLTREEQGLRMSSLTPGNE